MAEIIITDLSKPYTYKHKIKQGWQWAYMGKNIPERERIASILGNECRYLYADELKEISYRYKQKFLDWVSAIGKQYSKPIFWWTTRLASKSTFQTDFYLLFCYLVLLRKWSDQKNKKLIIFIEDAFLLEAAKDNLKSPNNDNIFFNISRYYYIKQYSYLTIRFMLIPSYFLIKYTIYYLLNWILKRKYKKEFLFKTDVLIHTWVEHRSFKNNKNFSDFYFGNLYSIYNEHAYKVATLSQFKLDRRLLKRSYQFKNILPLSYFMSFKTVLKVFFTYMPLFNTSQPLLDKFDLKFLLKGEKLKEKASPGIRIYYLEYQIYKQFSKSMKNTGLKAIIYPFENQPWEKVMLLAFKKERVPFKTIGYQHSSIPELLLLYDFGKDEMDKLPLPYMILTNGSYNEKRLKKAGFPCVCNGGSLRYQSRQFKQRNPENNILLLCSVSIEHTLALIYFGIKKLANSSKSILIKLHPDVSKKKVMHYIKKLPSQMDFASGSLYDLQNKFDTVIHTGTTAAIECLAMGKKVYKLKTELLDIDPLDGLIQQNEIDETTDLDSHHYNNYPVNVDFLYEDIQKSIWLNFLKASN